ncbi:hypothetical protein XENOCAPTIV_017187, partial [Xenoophorus captivus]
LNKSVDRNTVILEHHTPGPITRGVKERTSADDSNGRKKERSVPPCEEPDCPELEGSSSFGRFSQAVNVCVIKNLGKLFEILLLEHWEDLKINQNCKQLRWCPALLTRLLVHIPLCFQHIDDADIHLSSPFCLLLSERLLQESGNNDT